MNKPMLIFLVASGIVKLVEPMTDLEKNACVYIKNIWTMYEIDFVLL